MRVREKELQERVVIRVISRYKIKTTQHMLLRTGLLRKYLLNDLRHNCSTYRNDVITAALLNNGSVIDMIKILMSNNFVSCFPE